MFQLRPADQVPLYHQIRDGLRAEIESGRLSPGHRLPSSRGLAADLGVSRITVASAYLELEAEGLIESRLGSGTYVAPPWSSTGPKPSRRSAERLPSWQLGLDAPVSAERARMLREATRTQREDGAIPFAWARGDVTLFPAVELRRAIADAIDHDGAASLQYEVVEGHPALRSWIAENLRGTGMTVDLDDVVITAGAQQAIDLVTRALLRPRDRVVVEGPTFPGALEAFEAAQASLVEVPLDGEGLRADLLAQAVERERPRLIYTIPTFHNPTGTVMSAQRRREVLQIAERAGVPILEDDYVREVRFGSPIPPPLAALDSVGNVIHIGSFSKSLLPALRLGYAVARGPLRDRLVHLKRVADTGSTALLQRALARCLHSGAMHIYWKRSSRIYRRRQATMVQALRRQFLVGSRWTAAQGGVVMWVGLPGGISVAELFERALAGGVSFAAGEAFFTRPADQPFMRLNFAALPEEQIERGIAILGRLAREQIAAPTTRTA
jgi:GntR family transcriptional regulator/MocR family aminotransferase